jgi:NAD(P)-dependent dehydrogenase (short-subunit alcohol dehydrogenase family)
MKVNGQVVVVTGGANGIGRALCHVFHDAGAAHIVVADIDLAGAERLAQQVKGTATRCDVTSEGEISSLIAETESTIGPISLFCSNAGINVGLQKPSDNVASAPNELWEKSWQVNVMAHIYAARALIPRMIPRGGGYFLHTVSAAGLLSATGAPSYSVTKHAAIGFAESLAIGHKSDGIRVSVLCPQAVDTDLIRGHGSGAHMADGVLSPDEVAEISLRGIEKEDFLILPHQEVLGYMRGKVDNYDRWINGMAKQKARLAVNEPK